MDSRTFLSSQHPAYYPHPGNSQNTVSLIFGGSFLVSIHLEETIRVSPFT